MDLSGIKISPRYVKSDRHINGREQTRERCPKCSTLGQNFVVIDKIQLGCIQCGTVFLSKVFLEELRPRVQEILDGPDLVCDICGEFEGKNAMSLQTHKRHCRKRAEGMQNAGY